MSLLSDDQQIVRAPPPLPSMDYAQLLQQGIDAVQALAGASWTDYNEHDPGRTVLENLCYALTDLGYRCDFPVADVLAEQAPTERARYSTLFPGPRILTCNALTATDYRKLIIDRALSESWPNFRNLWVLPQDGQYTLAIEAIDPSQDCSALISKSRQCYAEQRNMGEDLSGTPTLLALCQVAVNATVEVTPEADADALAADLLFALQGCLVPFLHAVSVQAAQAAGLPPEAIYEGPPLQLGLLPDSQLQPLRTSLTQSELANAMLGVSGVMSLPVLQAQVGGQALNGSAAIPAGAVARLAPSLFAPLTALPFTLVCQGAPVSVDLARVQQLLDQRLASSAPTAGLAVSEAGLAPYGPAPAGQAQDIARYFSVQRQFPAIYGLGETGLALPQTTSADDVAEQTARLAMVKQLKAYLLFFEQWLADAQQQLARAGRLFSLDPHLDRSYFTQSLAGPEGPPAMADVLCAVPQPPARAPLGQPAAAAARYVAHLRDPDQGGLAMLRSSEYGTRAEAAAAGRQMLARGADPAHYQVRQLPGQQHHLWLEDEHGQPLAFGGGRHASAAEAGERVQALAALVARLQQAPDAADQALDVAERGHREVRLLDTQGQLLLSGRELTAAGQERWVVLLLRYGARRACYRAQALPGRRWRLVLADLDGRPFADGAQDFASAAEAEQQIPALCALIQGLCCDTAAQARQIQRLPDDGAGGGAADAGEDAERIRHYALGWARAVRDYDPFELRRNRVLDHLLAQFCERFDDLALVRLDPRPGDDKRAIGRDLVQWKQTFLTRYATPFKEPEASARHVELGDWLGGARSRGEQSSVQSGPVSRICLLLGIPTQEAQPLPYHYHDPANGSAPAAPPAGLQFTADQPAVLRALLVHGTEAANYRIVAQDGGHALQFCWPGAATPSTVHVAPDQAAAERAQAAAQDFFRAYPLQHTYAGERLHAIEHLHLKTGRGEDQAAHFYRHRVSLVLPDWPLRFQDPAFRAFAWQVAAENFPAHLQLDLHWLDQTSMQTFDQLHGAWLAARCGPADGGQHAHTALAAFIAGLNRAQED
ncbi:hypothetical protein [Massilia sp. TS11]|uniref:hypothetical protein n=1 Tax=Massilia sp. TS11 TaxID=2908003 RepID=UPI001EDBD111|nr:hypothetical protein [Massilia sp. TS11]MCG2584155.1 hypothetical protein [Massilia sp. TS11]